MLHAKVLKCVLVCQLVQVSSCGGNYLLNVGPTAEGRIPPQSVERLTQVGRWLKSNSESIYGARPSPFPYELPWGIITTKPGRVYLHVFEWPRGELVLYGLKSRVRRAYFLPNKTSLKFTQQSDASLGHDALTLRLPAAAPDMYDSVIALEVAGEPQVDSMLTQQPDGKITLPAHLGEVHRGAAESPSSGVCAWTRPASTASR